MKFQTWELTRKKEMCEIKFSQFLKLGEFLARTFATIFDLIDPFVRRIFGLAVNQVVDYDS